jgi:Domain of unknown function (DUF4389)
MSALTHDVAAPARKRGAGHALLIVLGALVALLGAALLAGGGVMLWLDQVRRDDAGFVNTSRESFVTRSYALTSDPFEVDLGRADRFVAEDVLGRVRLVAASGDLDVGIFVGIGRTADVERYLAGVERDQVVDVDYEPFDATYVRRPGGAPSTPPGEQRFWAASASGPGEQTIVWRAQSGNWTVVAMNADASKWIHARLRAGAELGFLGWLGGTFAGVGAVVLLAGVLLIVLGARRPANGAGGATVAAPLAATEEARAYPVQVEGSLDEPLSRWLWLVKWLLAIPHFVVLAFLWLALVVTTVAAFFSILFTGRYPRGLFEFNVGVLRWTWRVGFYATSAIGTDRYPPFTLGDADYPARLEVAYPERLSRGLVLVKSWLLALPHLLIVAAFTGSIFSWASGDWRFSTPSLLTILVVVAGAILLFRSRYNRDLFELLVGINRWIFRVVAYVALMRDEYPPFRLNA